MLQIYEDWQAETPTIILDIPSIQAKEHHTDEELRSLSLEAISVAYPSTTWSSAYTDGSAEEAAKMAEVELSSSSPTADPSESMWLQGSIQQTTVLQPTPCSQQPRPWTRKREFLPTRSILQSLQSKGGEQIFSNIRQELFLLENKAFVTLQWVPSHCGVGGNEEADRLSKMGSRVGAICTHHVLQRSKDQPKKQLQDGVATTPRHWDRRGQHPPAGQSSPSHNL